MDSGDSIYTVVGVDPGTTAAVAILDLTGSPVSIHSGKNFSIQNIISFIAQFGSPCIIASDVNPAPQAVEKLSRSFDCRLFVPPSDMSVEEKNMLTKGYSFTNFHQRDALAAALKALEYYKAKFSNVDTRLQDKNLLNYSESVKNLVLKGYTVEKAIETLQETEKPKKPEAVIVEPVKESVNVSELQKKITDITQTVERLTAYKSELEMRVRTLENALTDAQREIRLYDRETRKEVMESRTIKSKESVINRLREELVIEKERSKILSQENEILKEMQILGYSKKAFPVKVLNHFSREEIKAVDERFGIRSDDIIYLRDASGGGTSTARELVNRGVRAVITHERMSHMAEEEFTEAQIPVFSEEEVNLEALGNVGVVNKDLFENAYSRWKTHSQIAEAAIAEQQLEHIIGEYKEKRIKDESQKS
jgi:predicted RNase H-like nuclease (RuvC/YqgF family)